MEKAFGLVGLRGDIRVISAVENAEFASGTINVFDLANVDHQRLMPGRIQAMSGQAAFEYIDTAIKLALANKVDGVVTSAIHKESLHLAGHLYEGHTEIFADKTDSPRVTMMLASGDFRVTHVSTHCSPHFGLGDALVSQIVWPDGKESLQENVAVNQVVRISYI